MAEYVNKEEVLKRCEALPKLYREAMRLFIKEIPSVNIVRCKECVKRMREDCPMCNGCKLDRMPTEDDDYCSYGERKESE